MITIAEYPQIKIYWYDNDRTILVADIHKGWAWSDGHKAMLMLNETTGVWAESRPVYVVLNFMEDAQVFPKGDSALTNMRQILSDDPSHETLTICVAKANLLGNIINIVSRMYNLADKKSKLRYVATFENALDIIESHKLSEPQ